MSPATALLRLTANVSGPLPVLVRRNVSARLLSGELTATLAASCETSVTLISSATVKLAGGVVAVEGVPPIEYVTVAVF